MKRTIIFVVIFVLGIAASGYASQNPSHVRAKAEAERYIYNLEHPTDQQYMIGDWSGERKRLAEKGVVFSSTFVCDYLANVAGGASRGGRYDQSWGYDVNFNLEKLAGLIGLQFHISGLWRQGRNLSTDVIHNEIVCSTIYGHEQFKFYFLYLEQALLNDRLQIRIGRIAAGDDFAASPFYGLYVSNGIDGVPISIPKNMFFTVYPTATWGARAKLYLNDDFYIQSAIYNGDEGVGRDCMYGLDFSLRLKRGIAFAQELAYAPKNGIGPQGLPGHYKGGVYYNGEVQRDLYADANGASYAITGSAAKKHLGNYNVYLHADQMIYREKGTKDQGLTPVISVTLGPDDVNKFPLFLWAGLTYKGLIPDRDDDTTSFGLTYMTYSDALRESQKSVGARTQDSETVFEFTHRVQITKWMYMQPDIQYILTPEGTGDIDDAFVIGFQFGLVL